MDSVEFFEKIPDIRQMSKVRHPLLEIINSIDRLNCLRVWYDQTSCPHILSQVLHSSVHQIRHSYSKVVQMEFSEPQTGYIVLNADDIMFDFDDEQTKEIYVVCNATMLEAQECEVPARDNGTMGIFGYRNLVAAPFDSESMRDGKVLLPFYRAQFHIVGKSDINIYGLYVIQANALCVEVSAKSGEGEQKTMAWDLGLYADLSEGEYTSEVFFGNDEFVLSLPSSGIGGVESFLIDEGSFDGS